MTKIIVITIVVGFLLYWGALGIARRLRGEMPGRRPKGEKQSGGRHPDGRTPVEQKQPPSSKDPGGVRDARFRDVTKGK